MERQFKDELQELETERKIRYVTSFERLGREDGFREGEASVLRRQLKRRFKRLPGWVEERLTEASREELESWTDRVLEARALEEVFAADVS